MNTGKLTATSDAPGSSGPVDVPVDWDTLEDAFENNASEVHSYLNLASGEVVRLVDGIADPQLRARINRDRRYLRIEPVSSREQYRWMERFIGMLEPGELQDKLAQSVDGRGAFRRFKDALMAHAPEREKWFAFRGQRLAVFMEAWLKANTIRPVPRKDKLAAPAGDEEGAAESGRTPPKTAESYRRQLRDLLGTLSVKDLDKVLTFAEFVKAQRVVRGATRARGEESVARLSLRGGASEGSELEQSASESGPSTSVLSKAYGGEGGG